MNHGNVEQIDEPSKIYGFPRNRFVADFIGKISMINVQIVEATPSHLSLDAGELGEVITVAKEGVKAGDNGVMAIRPEQFEFPTFGNLD